jgi:hypothetical protein
MSITLWGLEARTYILFFVAIVVMLIFTMSLFPTKWRNFFSKKKVPEEPVKLKGVLSVIFLLIFFAVAFFLIGLTSGYYSGVMTERTNNANINIMNEANAKCLNIECPPQINNTSTTCSVCENGQVLRLEIRAPTEPVLIDETNI